MKTKKKLSLIKYVETKNRDSAKEQGFYDGRFKQKSIPNKKKQFKIKHKNNGLLY